MNTKKQELKSIWLQCLNMLFEKANENKQTEISIRASELPSIAKVNYPGNDYDNRFPSICNAMKSIIDRDNGDVETDGKYKSTSYTVNYKLPRKNPIENKVATIHSGRKHIKDIILRTNKNINKPTISEVEKYLNKWKTLDKYVLQESALNKLFIQTYPKNVDMDDILIKVCALNDFYSTNILSPFIIAKHILELNIDDCLKNNDLNIVNKIAFVNVGNKDINFYSFATKYCSHHKQIIYPIYDYYIEKILCYFRQKDKFMQFDNSDLKDYISFKNILEEFKKYYNLEPFNLKEIDKYLWQVGKEYFPRKYKRDKR